MNIIHIVSNIDLSSGGPSKSVSELAQNQAKAGHRVSIITKISSSPYIIKNKHPNLDIIYARPGSFKQALKKQLSTNSTTILHGHGLWQFPVHCMAKQARRYNIPYIISPRGMLEPWALNSGRIKKKIALVLFQKRDLKNAACIHSTSDMESENIKQIGLNNPIANIPNGIDPFDYLPNQKKIHNGKTILFLSRIHKKKGIEMLVEAWERLDKKARSGWKIVIAGNGEKNYIESLRNQIQRIKLNNDIKIVGAQFGEEKTKIFQNADLFVLPTYSENFGIVVAEAMAFCLPVITTEGTPWKELNTYKAGWWIEIGAQPLSVALTKAIQLNSEERYHMGINGRKLIEEKYNIKKISLQMLVLYNWILGLNEQPEFIYEK